VYFGASDPTLIAPPALGVFSVEVPDVGLLYGFGGDTLKVGLDHGPPDAADRPRRAVTAAEIDALAQLVRRFVPGADGPAVESLACRYTMAPSNRFAVGALPDRPEVFVAAACSGHGFKFGPAVGAAIADLVTGTPRPDLGFLAPAKMLG
jgi:glycine/D-amino acid oxidase-like deaminating enzyme